MNAHMVITYVCTWCNVGWDVDTEDPDGGDRCWRCGALGKARGHYYVIPLAS